MADYPVLDTNEEVIVIGDTVTFMDDDYEILSISLRWGTIGHLNFGNGIETLSYNVTKVVD